MPKKENDTDKKGRHTLFVPKRDTRGGGVDTLRVVLTDYRTQSSGDVCERPTLGTDTLRVVLTDYRTQPSGESWWKNFVDSLESSSVDSSSLESPSVENYLNDFCESLSGDSSVETFLNDFCESLSRDSQTLTDLDSWDIHVVDPSSSEDSGCDLSFDNLSSLQNLLDDISPDDWTELLTDVEDASFDVEAFVPLPDEGGLGGGGYVF